MPVVKPHQRTITNFCPQYVRKVHTALPANITRYTNEQERTYLQLQVTRGGQRLRKSLEETPKNLSMLVKIRNQFVKAFPVTIAKIKAHVRRAKTKHS